MNTRTYLHRFYCQKKNTCIHFQAKSKRWVFLMAFSPKFHKHILHIKKSMTVHQKKILFLQEVKQNKYKWTSLPIPITKQHTWTRRQCLTTTIFTRVTMALKTDTIWVPASGFMPANLYSRAVSSWILSCRKVKHFDLIIKWRKLNAILFRLLLLKRWNY